MIYFAKMLPLCGPDDSYYNSNGSCRTVEERANAITAQNTQIYATIGTVVLIVAVVSVITVIAVKKLRKGKK